MQHAMCLASILGPFLFIQGAWILFYHSNVAKVIASMKSTSGAMYILGVLNLLVGITILSLYHEWTWSFALLVTLLGWALFLRGLVIHFIPQVFMRKKTMSANALKIRGVIVLVWGFALSWFAFWM